ncbi:MAG: DUF192 domain-containing protein [Deltaproteobacteria bacterium]|nr:DUF192 domain-containing protein [Deltaproteobacteria bacterium]
MSKILGIFLVLFIFGSCQSGCGDNGTTPDTVTVITRSGSTEFAVEIADTAAERATGLMNRTDLSDRDGMLFIFDENTLTSFWMKDTPLSLDIIFIDENHRIIYVAENTEPFSEELITPTSVFRYVLEVKAGFADESGVETGDRVSLNI